MIPNCARWNELNRYLQDCAGSMTSADLRKHVKAFESEPVLDPIRYQWLNACEFELEVREEEGFDARPSD